MIENEIRGNLTPSDFVRLSKFLKNKGNLIKAYKRLSADISPGFIQATRTWKHTTNQVKDLRLKKSGKEEKISLKFGDFHDQKRREVEVKLQEGQFENSVELFSQLGFDSGMVYFWESWEYEYQGYEIKLSKYTDDYLTWEIESTEHLDPYILANELNLKPYSEDEHRKAIDWENQNIHQLYSPELIKKLLHEFKNG